MRDITKILRTVHSGVTSSLSHAEISGVTVGYSIVNSSGTSISIDLISMNASGSQSQDKLKYDCRVSLSAVFRLNGPGYSVTDHNDVIEAIYDTFQQTSTTGFIFESAQENELSIESVNDAGSVKDGPVADVDGSYVVRYIQDFNMVIQYD